MGIFHKFCKMGEGGQNKMTRWEDLLDSSFLELQINSAHLLLIVDIKVTLFINLLLYFIPG